tara:strand:+ start:316 stop:534 length:219 start_codon:yes stop_codon:yes gene_type:complete
MKVKDLLKFEVQAHKKKLPRDIRQLIFIEDKDLEKHLIHYIRTNKKLKKKLNEATALRLCVSYVSKVIDKVL